MLLKTDSIQEFFRRFIEFNPLTQMHALYQCNGGSKTNLYFIEILFCIFLPLWLLFVFGMSLLILVLILKLKNKFARNRLDESKTRLSIVVDFNYVKLQQIFLEGIFCYIFCILSFLLYPLISKR